MDSSKAHKDWDAQLETLDDLSEAVHYNRWIYQMMEPYLGSRVLEVGCGIGNMTRFLAEGREVLGSDIHRGYIALARKSLAHRKNISFKQIDLEKKFPLLGKFKPDTIVCINVLEHIRGDVGFIKECFRILPPHGRLLIFVPALPYIYGTMDEHYGHFRRYFKSELIQKMEENGFSGLKSRYLNLLGVFGWWWNGLVLKKSIVPKGQILIYDQLIRLMAPVEKWLPKPLGLSLFYAGEKP